MRRRSRSIGDSMGTKRLYSNHGVLPPIHLPLIAIILALHLSSASPLASPSTKDKEGPLTAALTTADEPKDASRVPREARDREARDNKYHFSSSLPLRYERAERASSNRNEGTTSNNSNRGGSGDRDRDRGSLKPEDSPEAGGTSSGPLEKRCTRCDYPYYDRYYDRGGYDRGGYYDRDRGSGGYDRDATRSRYYRGDRYDDDRYYDRGGGGGGGGGGGAAPYDRYYDRDRGYYDRDRGYADRDRGDYVDRGFGYDNRGYDFRGGAGGGVGGLDRDRDYVRGGGSGGDYYRDRDRDRGDGYYRPWDETYRGTSGFDNYGRGYYFASGRPEVGGGGGGGSGYWGNSGGGYASGWNYGGGRDEYRDRDRDRYSGIGGGYRDRATSYLYARPDSSPDGQTTGNSVNESFATALSSISNSNGDVQNGGTSNGGGHKSSSSSSQIQDNSNSSS